MLLMIMSALAAALAVSGETETLVTRNHQSLAQARAAAEAGLNRAAQVTIDWLAVWPNSYADAYTAVEALLDDPTVLGTTALGTAKIEFGTTYTLVAPDIKYEVFLVDEDDPSRVGGAQTLENDLDGTNDESGNDPTEDENKSLVVRSIGYGPNNARVELEAVITTIKLPAIVSDGDLDVGASVEIYTGDNGGIHANGTLTFTGNNTVEGISDPDDGTATATEGYVGGSTTPSGVSGDGYSKKPLPNINAADYLSWASYVLQEDGDLVCNLAGGCTIGVTSYVYNQAICSAGNNPHNQCQNNFGWLFDDGTPSWRMMATGKSNPPYAESIFYAETQVEFQQGGSAADPLNITVFAEGSIDVSGNPYLTPNNTEILFVTDADLEISGNLTATAAEGQMLVHEQVNINSSSCEFHGQILIEDAEEADGFVTRSNDGIQGCTITFTGGVGNAMFSVTGWREAR